MTAIENRLTIALFGSGKMGQLVENLALSRGHDVLNAKKTNFNWDSIDVCIDFSHASVAFSHLQTALEAKKPIVIGTTGWDHQLDEAKKIVESCEGSVLYAPNFSLGVALFSLLAKRASELFKLPDYEAAGIEYHHREKQDAPSGTAKLLSSLFEPQVNFTSIRCGQIPGTHTLIFDSQNDQITLTHQAKNRNGFASGALAAAKWIKDRKGWWIFEDMVRTLYSPHYTL